MTLSITVFEAAITVILCTYYKIVMNSSKKELMEIKDIYK